MPSLTVKYGQRAATLPLPPTVGALRVAIRAEFGLPAEGGALTLISSGRMLADPEEALPSERLVSGGFVFVRFEAGPGGATPSQVSRTRPGVVQSTMH